MTCHRFISVSDASSVGEVRRAATGLAEKAKFNPADAGRAAIVATELATNLLRHARPPGGTILLAAEVGGAAVEITSIDSGPGMSNVARCFEDGYSTAGTPGNGLGAVRRLSEEQDVFSADSGTVLWCRLSAGRLVGRPPGFRAAGVSAPATGETVCGDSWRIARADDGRLALTIADGLGHGILAEEASASACAVFDADPLAGPAVLMERMHAAIGGTRGAAVAIGQISPSGDLAYCGVGNIAGTLLAADGSSRGLFSHNGTVGHTMRKAQRFDYPAQRPGLLVMHSDGLLTRWTLEKYPGLIRRHPGVIAGAMLRDFRRGRDDVSVVVVDISASAH